MKIRLLLYIAFSLLLASCISPVDIGDQLDEQEKLVLYCRLCPQIDTISIYLSHTHLVLGENTSGDFQAISNGVVELSSDNEHWIPARYNAGKKRYILTQSDFPIVEGQTYYIRASAPNYEDVTSSCTVPFTRDIQPKIILKSVATDTHYGEVYDFAHTDAYLQWTDYPGEPNYYSFGEIYDYEYPSYDDPDISFTSYSYYNIYLTDNEGADSFVFSDQQGDGATTEYLYDEVTDIENNDAVELYILQFDEHSYKYEYSYYKYSYMELPSTFLMEPIHTYNNINNGFGLFGAMTIQKKQVSAVREN